jgi:hypothetical protein
MVYGQVKLTGRVVFSGRQYKVFVKRNRNNFNKNVEDVDSEVSGAEAGGDGSNSEEATPLPPLSGPEELHAAGSQHASSSSSFNEKARGRGKGKGRAAATKAAGKRTTAADNNSSSRRSSYAKNEAAVESDEDAPEANTLQERQYSGSTPGSSLSLQDVYDSSIPATYLNTRTRSGRHKRKFHGGLQVDTDELLASDTFDRPETARQQLKESWVAPAPPSLLSPSRVEFAESLFVQTPTPSLLSQPPPSI